MKKILAKIVDEMPDYISDFFRHRFDLPPSSDVNPNSRPYYEDSEQNDSHISDISTHQAQGHTLFAQEAEKKRKKIGFHKSQGRNPTQEAFDKCHYKPVETNSNGYSGGGAI